MAKFERFNEHTTYSKRELNKLLSEVERQSRYSVDGIDGSNDSSGLHLSVPEDGFYAMLLSDAGDCSGLGFPYSWEEVVPDGSGSWQLLDNPRTDSDGSNPAYSTKGECLDSGSIVWLKYGANHEMLFDDCCASPSMACVSYLQDLDTTKTLSWGGDTFLVCDENCDNCVESNCVKYVSDVTCSDVTTKTATTRYLKWTGTGLQSCSDSGCTACLAVSTCLPFVQSAACVGNDYVVEKKHFVFDAKGGFSVADDDCPACCYTATDAVDDVGAALVDSTTVDFTASTTITADVKKQMSITSDASGLKLSGDSSSPGNSKYYGTDSGGTKGFNALPTAGGLTVSDTATVDLTLSGSALSADVFKQMSITSDASGLKLSGDSSSPGNSKYYGTDGGGTKGFNALPMTAVSDTATVDLTLSSGTLSADVFKQMSITSDASGLKLSGDSSSPGNSKYYGTDSGGTKGFNALPMTAVSDTATVDLTLSSGTLSADVFKQMSITSDASGLKLSGDASSPGNSKYYGTDGSGTKGFNALPTAGGLTVTDTATVDLTLSGSALSADVFKQMSITSDASGLKLSGDSSSPGNSKYYGTDGSGTKGFNTLPSAISEASQADMETDTNSSNYVSARRVHSSPGVAKCWAYVTQTTTPASISASYGLSSITDNGVGDISYNFSTAFSGAGNFSFLTWCDISSGSPTNTPPFPNVTTYGTSTVELVWVNSAGTPTDMQFSMVSFLGDQ